MWIHLICFNMCIHYALCLKQNLCLNFRDSDSIYGKQGNIWLAHLHLIFPHFHLFLKNLVLVFWNFWHLRKTLLPTLLSCSSKSFHNSDKTPDRYKTSTRDSCVRISNLNYVMTGKDKVSRKENIFLRSLFFLCSTFNKEKQ